MDKLAKYRQIIKQVLTEYAAIPYKYGDIVSELIISQDENRFILITQGWEKDTTELKESIQQAEQGETITLEELKADLDTEYAVS